MTAAARGQRTQRNEYAEAISVPDVLVRAADAFGDAEALVLPEARFTFTQLRAEAELVAAGLYTLGVRPGDRVGILMPNTPDFVHCFYGAAMLGAVVLPINARYKRRELRYVIADAELTVLLTTDVIAEHADYVKLLRECFPELVAAADPRHLELADAPWLKSIVLFGASEPPGVVTGGQLRDLAKQTAQKTVSALRQRIRLRDVAMMMYTSGTTANPKGCPITHEALVRVWLVLGRLSDVRQGDRFWVPMPMFHVSGLGPLLFVPAVGATYISLTHFDPVVSLRQIREERPTQLWPLFPFILMALLRHPDYDPQSLERVRSINHNAPAETVQVAASLMPPGIVQISYFGLTEVAGAIATTPPHATLEERMRNVFEPIPGVDIRVVDPDTGTDVQAGETGEILIRGYSVFDGYFNEPEITAATLQADGWFHTGDLGVLVEGGFTYSGRMKEMLRVGGENVAAAEIEAVLSTHPAVQVAQVIGRPDTKYGEVPVAFIQLSSGTDVDGQELIKHCRGELASWKVPREVRFVQEWPTSATKIQKYKLSEFLEQPADAPR